MKLRVAFVAGTGAATESIQKQLKILNTQTFTLTHLRTDTCMHPGKQTNILTN